MRIFGIEFGRKKKVAYVGEIAKVKVSGNDMVVLTVPRSVDASELSRISSEWEKKFGDNATLLVLFDGMKIGVLSPEDKAEQFKKEQEDSAIAALVETIK